MRTSPQRVLAFVIGLQDIVPTRHECAGQTWFWIGQDQDQWRRSMSKRTGTGGSAGHQAPGSIRDRHVIREHAKRGVEERRHLFGRGCLK